jgi:4-amino-4-deoxy-L-arabinose transferase-like glycosyltransferase
MKWKRPSLSDVLLWLAVLIMAAVRIRLLTVPLERDEGEYAYGGQLLLQGVPPYQQFYNMKFPGIYAAYAAIMGLFGQSPAGIHLGLLLVNAASVFLLYAVARRCLEGPGPAVAASAYALLSACPSVLGLEAHATQFVVAAALAGLWLLGWARDSGRWWLFSAGGAALALSCLMKQPGALFLLFGFCAVAASKNWRHAAAFATGAVAPFLVTAIWLLQAGVFRRFWFWTVTYAGVHASENSWNDGLSNLMRFLRALPWGGDGLFWIAAGIGLAGLMFAPGEKGKKLWLGGFLAASVVAVSLSFNFSTHYFVMLLPALCLLTGWAAAWAARWTSPKCPGIACAVFFALTLLHYRGIFFELTPDEVCKRIFRANPFVECREIARYIEAHSAPGSTIAVLGSEPELPFYAHRHSAASYIYMYDLIETQPYAAAMQREMIQQIEAARPEYLVFVKIPASWDMRADFGRAAGTQVMAWSSQFAQSNYEPVGLVVVKPQSDYFFEKDMMSRPPPGELFISILKRK